MDRREGLARSSRHVLRAYDVDVRRSSHVICNYSMTFKFRQCAFQPDLGIDAVVRLYKAGMLPVDLTDRGM